MKSKTYMLLVVGLLLIFIASASAAPLKLPASSKAPAGPQMPVATPQGVTPAAIKPNLIIKSFSRNPGTTTDSSPFDLIVEIWNKGSAASAATQQYSQSCKVNSGGPACPVPTAIGTLPSIPANGTYKLKIAGLKGTEGSYEVTIKLLPESDNNSQWYSFPIGPKIFALTAPNGGESWPLGSTHQITWSPGDLRGNVRLDLYKDGTERTNKVGVITDNTPATVGKYSWKVGEIGGGNAAAGDGYRVVVSSYTPEKKDASKTAFRIAPFAAGSPSINSVSNASMPAPYNTVRDDIDPRKFWLKDQNCSTLGQNSFDRATASAKLLATPYCDLRNDSSSRCKWRLPTNEELRQRAENMEGHGFINLASGGYWSSSIYADNYDKAWVVVIGGSDNGKPFPAWKADSKRVWPICDFQ